MTEQNPQEEWLSMESTDVEMVAKLNDNRIKARAQIADMEILIHKQEAEKQKAIKEALKLEDDSNRIAGELYWKYGAKQINPLEGKYIAEDKEVFAEALKKRDAQIAEQERVKLEAKSAKKPLEAVK